MFPKATLDGLDPNCPGVTAIPVSGTESVALLALEPMVSEPLAAPAAEGAKTTLNAVLCPALRVMGKPVPLSLNPVPAAAALDSVTDDAPVLETVTGRV
jgi:hypothetical protein